MAWDHEIEWSETRTIAAPLVGGLRDRMRQDATVIDGRIDVVSIRPVGEAGWLCSYVGEGIEQEIDNADPGDEYEVRFGRGPLGCVERMPEWDGW